MLFTKFLGKNKPPSVRFPPSFSSAHQKGTSKTSKTFQVVFNSPGADLPTMRSLQTPDQRSPCREDGGLRKEEVEADEGKKMKKRKGRRRGGQERVTEEDERQVK